MTTNAPLQCYFENLLSSMPLLLPPTHIIADNAKSRPGQARSGKSVCSQSSQDRWESQASNKANTCAIPRPPLRSTQDKLDSPPQLIRRRASSENFATAFCW